MTKKKVILASILFLIIVLLFVLFMVNKFRSYNVYFDTDGGSNVEVQNIIINNKAISPVNPIKSEYLFDGWYLDGEEFDFDTKIKEDITLTAKWKSIIVPT